MSTTQINYADEFEKFVRSRPADEVIKHGDIGWIGCGCALDLFVAENPSITHYDMKHELKPSGRDWIWEILNNRGDVVRYALVMYWPDPTELKYEGDHTVDTYGKLVECFDYPLLKDYLDHLTATGR